ncbi:MAG: N(4)-(beta-N-acetylglucosaminyl)-L-asparaginase [Ignavibacteria bacterium]|jgi:isoaspartyl peptidase/L-asparaginase-like protein (Ntn-hydrolase superfamily)
MTSRRKFIQNTLALASTSVLSKFAFASPLEKALRKTGEANSENDKVQRPVVISTWNFGVKANESAWEILDAGGRCLDAVEAGVRVIEADPSITTVGYGGYPDKDGYVTLGSCIMDEYGNAGSVAFLQDIMHPSSVARLVMEKTPFVMLVGSGAHEFALANGFKEENLLTKEIEQAWKEWDKEINSEIRKIDKNNHDTIGMLALDVAGNIAGVCTTSGLQYKMHGRVADSAIIGAGLFSDNEVGAATATGMGEAVIKITGSHTVVEQMRQGKSPQEACKEAVYRIAEKQKNYKDFQVAFIALNKEGEIGAYAIRKGFQYAVYAENENRLVDSEYLVKS